MVDESGISALSREKRIPRLQPWGVSTLDTLLSQNKKRLQYSDGIRYVPEQVIRGIYQKMEPIPKGIYTIDVTKPDVEENFVKSGSKS